MHGSRQVKVRDPLQEARTFLMEIRIIQNGDKQLNYKVVEENWRTLGEAMPRVYSALKLFCNVCIQGWIHTRSPSNAIW